MSNMVYEQKSIIRAKYATGRVKNLGHFDLEGLRQPGLAVWFILEWII